LPRPAARELAEWFGDLQYRPVITFPAPREAIVGSRIRLPRPRLAALAMLALAGGIAPAPVSAQEPALEVEFVGNAGVVLTDGTTSLLVDLPYEPGAFGYQRYDPARLRPAGEVVAVITHHHRDHFAPDLFLPHAGWRVIGPPSAVTGVPSGRVIGGDSVAVGAFQVVAIRTPHTDDHRSYRIRWRGRVLHFTGDTESSSALLAGPPSDVLFITPWLACVLADAGQAAAAVRMVLYHPNPDGSDRICGSPERLEQGARFRLPTSRPGSR
jgi:hypothetical protein